MCRVDVPASPTSSSSHHDSSDVSCQPTSGHVTHTGSPGQSLVEALHAQTSAARSRGRATAQSTLAGAVLGGVDLSLAAVVLGTSHPSAVSPRRPPEMHIHVTTDSPEREAAGRGQVRPASGIGRRSAGVPHGSVRALQEQQQQHSCRQRQTTLLVVPSSRRGGSVSTSPSSASPSPSPEPVSRSHSSAGVPSRSLSTHRPLGVTRSTGSTTDEHAKAPRTCPVQRHCDQRQRTGAQATRTDEQRTFV